ncbi:MAG: hypothetical protein F6J97_16155, partial [Leptolyngbya sp. SIO4C1]|nr:hypothetical protein [Leptolyngbya sp. SIO4C1]
ARDNARAQLRSLEAQRIRIEAEVELQNTEYDRAQRLVAATVGICPSSSAIRSCSLLSRLSVMFYFSRYDKSDGQRLSVPEAIFENGL